MTDYPTQTVGAPSRSATIEGAIQHSRCNRHVHDYTFPRGDQLLGERSLPAPKDLHTPLRTCECRSYPPGRKTSMRELNR